jgi:hypothetical protein
MTRTSTLLFLSLLLPSGALAGQTGQVHLNTVATSESGTPLAHGTFRLETDAQGLNAPSRGTTGHSHEPVAMYMLASYLFGATPEMLKFYPFEGVVATRLNEWDTKAVMQFDGYETVAGPAGTFPAALKHKTVLTDAHADPQAASAFVNGTRYLWFARGVGLVRMRYEHANGVTTEATLLSYKVSRSDDYLPLQEGNRWTYAWKNDYREEAVLETWTLSRQADDMEKPAPSRREAVGAPPEMKAVDSDGVKLDLSADTLLKIAANPVQGFHFPYYLFIPATVSAGGNPHILVETNNTGTTSDDLAVHDQRARNLAERSYANRIARQLNTPLLVPVFPRPRAQWQAYTHSLDEDTLLIKTGPLARIDLQLIQMIRDAQALLRRNHVAVRDKVFMDGFSASGVFANRFPILHPEIVRATAAGGVNSIPIFPATFWKDARLPYPVGIADLQEITGSAFDEKAYRQVAQYLYMGYLDRNDTTLSRDAFSEEHARLIRTLIGADMGERWKVSQSLYRELGVPAQCVTYNGTAHEIRPEMLDDVVRFFRANTDEGFTRIEPHEYPFVEFREIKVAHINGLYWEGDEKLPEWARQLSAGQDDFIITIKEWVEGQDHQQLTAFREKCVFEFLLRAEEHADIHVTGDAFRGTCSSGHGDFQGFVVCLPAAERDQMARGVPYTITPVNQAKEYYWEVGEGVALVRP